MRRGMLPRRLSEIKENPMAANPALLSLRNITKRFPSVVANDDISFDVHSGSIHAILGENGAGKSTLMKLVYGLLQADAGEMIWRGQPARLRNPAVARRLGIGMVFQHFSLFETLTVVENISLTIPGRRQDLAQQIREIGERFQLPVEPAAFVHSLSVGERQRVEIIRCLMQDLRLLILDEPTSVLPPQHIGALFDALRKLRDSGVAILFISHKLEEIRELCDTATVLRAGRVAGTVDPTQVSTRELATLMIGHEISTIQAQAAARKSAAPLLELNAVSVASQDPFGTHLKQIDLQVHGGEIVGIAGVSGNGQRELARLISGEQIEKQLPADAIRMMGKPVSKLGAAERRALGFAFVPEERLGRGAVPALTLADNSLLTAFTKGLLKGGFVRRGKTRQYTQRCIDEFDVRCGGIDASAGSLSGGNLQKFIIGRELSLAPTLLFVAQPTWGVDIGAAAAIRQRLLDLRDAGIGILLVSEELEELFEVTDRLYVINQGTLTPSLDTRDVTPNDIGEYMIGHHQSEDNRRAG